jgi:Zn ribbon nucleic-acid-binding protein
MSERYPNTSEPEYWPDEIENYCCPECGNTTSFDWCTVGNWEDRSIRVETVECSECGHESIEDAFLLGRPLTVEALIAQLREAAGQSSEGIGAPVHLEFENSGIDFVSIERVEAGARGVRLVTSKAFEMLLSRKLDL